MKEMNDLLCASEDGDCDAIRALAARGVPLGDGCRHLFVEEDGGRIAPLKSVYPIVAAAEAGQCVAIECLLALGSPVGVRATAFIHTDEYGPPGSEECTVTPLLAALYPYPGAAHVEAALLLLERGADPNPALTDGHSAMTWCRQHAAEDEATAGAYTRSLFSST